MGDFDLKYGDPDDFMNAAKMLDFKTVRRKNYESILVRTNKKPFSQRSSSYNIRGDESPRWAVPVEKNMDKRAVKNAIFADTTTPRAANKQSDTYLPVIERK